LFEAQSNKQMCQLDETFASLALKITLNKFK